MPRKQMLEVIPKLHFEMAKLTLEAGVGPKRYKSLNERLEHKKDETLTKIWNFLGDVKQTEFLEVKRIWNLPTMTPDTWANYLTIFDDTDFPEVKLLKKARRKLKARYGAFFKTKKKQTGKEDTNSVCNST